MSSVLKKLLEQHLYKHWNGYRLSSNPSFQIEWLELFPKIKWSLKNVIWNSNFKLEWIARYPHLKWNVAELNRRLEKGDLLIMPNVLMKIKDLKSLSEYGSFVKLDFNILSSHTFEKEEKILRKSRMYIYRALIKYVDKEFIQHVLLNYFR